MIMGTARRRVIDMYGFPTSPNTESMVAAAAAAATTTTTTSTVASKIFFPQSNVEAATAAAATTIETEALTYNIDEDENRTRAEYMSVTFRKKAAHTRLGINVNTNEYGHLIVGEMDNVGVLHRSILREGDEFDTVNGKKFSNNKNISEMELVDMLRESTGQMSITVYNRLGKENFVEVMVEKINSSDIGIAFTDEKVNNGKKSGFFKNGKKNRNNSSGIEQSEHLMISRLDSNGIFKDSLLSVGDRIVSINGTEYKRDDEDVAMDNMRKSLRFITIVAEKQIKTTTATTTTTTNRQRPVVKPSSSPGGNTELEVLQSPSSTTDESTVVTHDKETN